MDIIRHLNELRLERNMSVYRLSELTGINQSTLANTFSRNVVPSVKNLVSMCEAMGITPAQFFTEGETCGLLTEEETAVIEDFRSLPPEIRQSVAALLHNMSIMPK